MRSMDTYLWELAIRDCSFLITWPKAKTLPPWRPIWIEFGLGWFAIEATRFWLRPREWSKRIRSLLVCAVRNLDPSVRPVTTLVPGCHPHKCNSCIGLWDFDNDGLDLMVRIDVRWYQYKLKILNTITINN